MSCPNPIGWGEVVNDQDQKIRRFFIPCGKWGCSECAKMNARRLQREVQAAIDGYLREADKTSAKFPYSAKFFSLTVPGADYRAVTPIEEAERQSKAALNKTIKMLRKHYHVKDYLWVMEQQRDGYPHYHLLLLGPEIADKSILPFMVGLWTEKYGMGNADVEVVRNPKSMGWYISKYVSKGKSSAYGKNGHVFAFSKGLQKHFKEAKRGGEWTLVKLGFLNPDGSAGRVFWEVGSECSAAEALRKANLQECLDFFDSCGKSDQLKIWEVPNEDVQSLF